MSEIEAEQAIDEGLEGNHEYSDLRGLSVNDLQAVLLEEERWLADISQAESPGVVEERLVEMRGAAFEPAEELWGLDLGVASAVVALSCLGACPVASCNGGSFGSSHQASYAYVSFFLYEASLEQVLALASQAQCGLIALEGLGHLYGPIETLMSFAHGVRQQSRTLPTV